MAVLPILSIDQCVNLEEFFLLCVNIREEEYNDIQFQLRSSINYQKLFKDSRECEQYILQNVSNDDRIVLIINDAPICQELLIRVHPLRQVLSIHVRCLSENNEKAYIAWSTQFNKVRGIFTEIGKLVLTIQCDQARRCTNRYINSPFSSYIFNTGNAGNPDRSSSDINAEFLHSLLIMDVLLRMKRIITDPNNELIHVCKNAYKDSPRDLAHVEKFALTYTSNRALWWYTQNCFLYRLLNKAFRVGNTNLLYLFRSFIIDLYDQLKECQCSLAVCVYRGQLMTSYELDHLQCSIGHYISMNSFLSTTLRRDLAIFYLGESDDSHLNLERVLFEINADPEIDGIKPFGKISRLSAFPDENEVLFMARSIFEIVDFSPDHTNNLSVVRMALCGEKQNHLKAMYEQNRKHYGGGCQRETNSMTLGNVLQRMGRYDDAELFYRRQLNELYTGHSDDRLFSACYFNVGEALREKGEYESSMLWYQRSLDIDTKTLPGNHPNIGNTFNSMGIVHEKKGDYETALDAYSIALRIALQHFGWNDTRVALCLNNMGNTYQAIGNYLVALDCHQIALKIRQKNLPADHHRLASSHNNIAVVYHRLGHFDLAHERYKIARLMDQKSLPSDHPDIRKIMRNIGLLHESRGNFQQAFADFEQEANRRRKFLQCTHVDIIEIEADIKRLKLKSFEGNLSELVHFL